MVTADNPVMVTFATASTDLFARKSVAQRALNLYNINRVLRNSKAVQLPEQGVAGEVKGLF